MSDTIRIRRILPVIALIAVLLLGGAAFFVFTFGLYTKHWDSPLIRNVVGAVPISAAKLGKRTMSYREYLSGADSFRTFLASDEAKQQGLSRDIAADDLKQVVERRLRELAVEEVAEARGMTVAQDEIDAAMKNFYADDRSKAEFEAYLQTNYQWTLDDFLTHVVRPAIFTQKLSGAFAADHGGDPNAFEDYLTERLARPDVVRYLRW